MGGSVLLPSAELRKNESCASGESCWHSCGLKVTEDMGLTRRGSRSPGPGGREPGTDQLQGDQV